MITLKKCIANESFVVFLKGNRSMMKEMELLGERTYLICKN